jgi:hypothetical protein
MARKAARGARAKAILVLHEKVVRKDGTVIELVMWRLPKATPDRPHGIKYRLYYGRGSSCLVRYDNESGKGDHRHVLGREEPYEFVSVSKLRHDFESDIARYGDGDEKED